MSSFLYILHFDEKVGGHAIHYCGVTRSLKQRLLTHARGQGSRLTRELHRLEIPWTLTGLYEVALKSKHKVERHCKDQGHLSRYCGLCSDVQARLPLARQIDIDLLTIPTTSLDILAEPFALISASPERTTRTSLPGEKTGVMASIRAMMQADKHSLGFIPAGGSEGLQFLADRCKIVLAEERGDVIGYTAFTTRDHDKMVTIQQCCTRDDARLTGVGKAMVNQVLEIYEGFTLQCHVRHDLPANDFWSSIGFIFDGTKIHRTSRQFLNHYTHPGFTDDAIEALPKETQS